MNDLIVRAATSADTDQIERLALDNHMFQPDEMGDFREMLAGYLDGSMEGHRWLVAESPERPGTVVGGAYVAPEPFADRMWNLYFLATAPDAHGSGAGTALIEQVEADLRSAGPDVARTLIVDTSSTDDYADSRAFYARRGFVEEARIRDYYGPGDHRVVFWKSLV